MTRPFSDLDHVESLLSTLEIPYFYIGGWGIDLFLGYETRSHSDIEITIYRHQQQKLHQWALSSPITQLGYTLHVVDPPGTANTPIWNGSYLDLPIHQLQVYKLGQEGDIEARIVDIMLTDLDPEDHTQWHFRRDPTITASRSQIEQFTKDDIPYHAPELLLLYKSKRNAVKDVRDRDLAWPKMSNTSKDWFLNTMQQYDYKHPWMNELFPL